MCKIFARKLRELRTDGALNQPLRLLRGGPRVLLTSPYTLECKREEEI